MKQSNNIKNHKTLHQLPNKLNKSNDKHTNLGKRKLIVLGISGQIIVELVQKGNQYVLIEKSKNKLLRKVGNEFYLIDGGEYYKIVNGNLRMCDKLGDFTENAG